MVQYAFQQIDELFIDLGKKVMEVAHEVFVIVDGLQKKSKGEMLATMKMCFMGMVKGSMNH
jgi:hypothetical protein